MLVTPLLKKNRSVRPFSVVEKWTKINVQNQNRQPTFQKIFDGFLKEKRRKSEGISRVGFAGIRRKSGGKVKEF